MKFPIGFAFNDETEKMEVGSLVQRTRICRHGTFTCCAKSRNSLTFKNDFCF